MGILRNYTTVLIRHRIVIRLDVILYLHHKYPKWVDLYNSIKHGNVNLEYTITENEYGFGKVLPIKSPK